MTNKKTIRINFVDFWGDFSPYANFFIDSLSNLYDIEISDNPDYLFYSTFGRQHHKYKNSIKIFFTGENIIPNFNLCDYALGFEYLSYGDRYLRLPLYCIYKDYHNLHTRTYNPDISFAKRKFCCMVVSNARHASPMRELFFKELSKYKTVDSGGRLWNNVGGPVSDKLKFLSAYKFNIAFENSSCAGYTTEKIVDPLIVNSVPIYWGNPKIEKDFNKQAFINITDSTSIDAAIERIIHLDTHDDEYLDIIKAPFLTQGTITDPHKLLRDFLINIIEKPLDQAKYMSPYGMQKLYVQQAHISDVIYSRLRINKIIAACDKLKAFWPNDKA